MLIAIICLDKPGALEIRKANRDAHLAHIRGADGAIVQAGPFLDGAGEMCGSLLIYEGAATAGPVAALAARLGVEMPVAAMVAVLVAGELAVPEAVSILFNRPLRRE